MTFGIKPNGNDNRYGSTPNDKCFVSHAEVLASADWKLYSSKE